MVSTASFVADVFLPSLLRFLLWESCFECDALPTTWGRVVLCVVCLLDEESEWLDEVRSTMEGRLIGDGEIDGISEDRQASACGCDELADLDTKWEKVAGSIEETDRKAAGRVGKP